MIGSINKERGVRMNAGLLATTAEGWILTVVLLFLVVLGIGAMIEKSQARKRLEKAIAAGRGPRVLVEKNPRKARIQYLASRGYVPQTHAVDPALGGLLPGVETMTFIRSE
jgi:hypothetical protein